MSVFTAPARRVQVDVDPAYEVLIGEGLLASVGEHVSEHQLAVISDENVAALYAPRLRAALEESGKSVVTLGVAAGEASKQVAAWQDLLEGMALAGIGRDGAVLALGGGVIGDLAGFTAAAYLRGIALYQLPTSLLAMVDSSVGGKTGLDLPHGKNLVGAFWQPRTVIADVATLTTLPAAEFRQGTVELVKTGFIGDPWLVELVEGDWQPELAPEVMIEAVARAVAVKAGIVAADERESGVRAYLNLGHTLGHGVEAASGLILPHGDAVLYGMLYAALLARELEISDLVDRFYGLVDRLQPRPFPDLSFAQVRAYMARDKKVVGGRLKFVLLAEVGSPVIVDDIDDASLKLAWQQLKELVA